MSKWKAFERQEWSWPDKASIWPFRCKILLIILDAKMIQKSCKGLQEDGSVDCYNCACGSRVDAL